MTTTTTHPATQQALASSLTYTDETPEWFQELVEECVQQDKAIPEIMDEIAVGYYPLLVVWYPESPERLDRGIQKRGYVVSKIEYRDIDTGEIFAVMKVSYTTPKSIQTAEEPGITDIVEPCVDWVMVADIFRGQGLGASVYVYMARKLATFGRTLRSAGVQSPEAVALWDRMQSDPQLPVHGDGRYLFLDFCQEFFV